MIIEKTKIENTLKILFIVFIFGALYSCGSIERLIIENETYNCSLPTFRAKAVPSFSKDSYLNLHYLRLSGKYCKTLI